MNTLNPGETVLHKGGANHQRGWESVGGQLFLSHQRLWFVPHGLNFNTASCEIPVARIVEVRLVWTRFLGKIPLFPNAIAVQLRDGEEARFTVFARKAWKAAIEQAVAAARAHLPGTAH